MSKLGEYILKSSEKISDRHMRFWFLQIAEENIDLIYENEMLKNNLLDKIALSLIQSGKYSPSNAYNVAGDVLDKREEYFKDKK